MHTVLIMINTEDEVRDENGYVSVSVFSEPSAHLYSSHLLLEINCVDQASDCNEQNITNKVVKKLYNSLLK